MSSISWRNWLRVGLLITGTYLWQGGRIGPPPCKIVEVERRKAADGALEVTLAVSGTPTAANIRRHVERYADTQEAHPVLRIQVVRDENDDLLRAVQQQDRAYLMRNRMATYQRTDSHEFFIDTHRVGEENRGPFPVGPLTAATS